MIRRSTLLLAGAAGLLALRPGAGIAQQAAGTAATASPDQTSRMALGGMAFALATSQLAQQRGENALVKTFAGLETEEQQAFAQARQMAGLPAPAPSMMDAQKQQMVQQLQSLTGAQFDRMYIQGQLTGHQELLQLHQAIAQSGATREERMLGTVAVPAIKSHLAMLQGIQQGMRG